MLEDQVNRMQAKGQLFAHNPAIRWVQKDWKYDNGQDPSDWYGNHGSEFKGQGQGGGAPAPALLIERLRYDDHKGEDRCPVAVRAYKIWR